MSALINYFRSLWILIFRRNQVAPAGTPRGQPLALPAPKPAAGIGEPVTGIGEPRPSRERRPPDTLKRTVLDELGVYFPYLARMKRGDRESYDLYSRIGAQIWHDRIGIDDGIYPKGENSSDQSQELCEWWRDHRPGFGALAFPGAYAELELKQGSKYIYPRFVYFRKYKLPPAQVQPLRGGDIYSATVYWDSLTDKNFKRGAPTEFPVLIDKDCNLTILKTIMTRRLVARSRKGGTTVIPQRAWSIPEFFESWARQNGQPVDDYLKGLFCLIANRYAELSHSLIHIRAMKRHLAAVFSIDVLKTPQFFADREVEALDCNGHRKKIFHIVRTHERGSNSFVKTHFRGVRKFTWNGYAIEISVPFRDHLNIGECDIGFHDLDEAKRVGVFKENDFATNKELGEKLEKWRAEGRGALRRRA